MATGEAIESLPPVADDQKQSLAPDIDMPDAAPEDPSADDVANAPKTSSQSSGSSSFYAESETSTLKYSQTPFEEYKTQVQQLCHLLWSPSSPAKAPSPFAKELRSSSSSRFLGVLRKKKATPAPEPKAPPKQFLIERIRGGTYNRVTGVTILDPNGKEENRFVLREPRFAWESTPEREVAILRYVRQYTSIPVPEVIAVDYTSNNLLKDPYVVQKRVPGMNVWAAKQEREITTEQWCIVAREVGRTMLELQKLTNPTPGFIEPSSNEDGRYSFSVVPFDIRSARDPDWKKKAATVTAEKKASVLELYKESTFQFLITQFGRWMADELDHRPGDILHWDYMYRLAEVAAQMDKMCFLGDDINCLAHLDLAGRNIMVEFPPGEPLKITGYLDWDSAVFAPRFVSCAPPWWLWQDDDDETDYQEDESKANETPAQPHKQEIKRAFEETVGEDFLTYAYKPQFQLARKLFHIAKHGNTDSGQFQMVQDFLDEWAAFRDKEMEELSEDDPSETEDFQECEGP
ncbi:hypothetical protein JMJ35_008414 [Cladonia borealis]|uniref:Aminoglycoside phosphotransferase domain-containing protein n=1 Tax=Cladonia borealis TaxID=184061 RepID=A0AA39QTT0_9LECA|nr:hypothetical protein JMJ35_008414 [Cladonia borealis]